MSKSLSLLSGMVAALALAGCGTSTTVTNKVVPDDLCVRFAVDCQDETGLVSCDPVDGQCKCGGANGVFCSDDEVCTLGEGASAPACVSPLCADVRCGRYETCDPADGLCKCNGVACAAGSACVRGACVDDGLCEGITCREGETCDPADGVCKCGDEVCTVGQSCRPGADGAGRCVGQLCVGNNCPAGTTCSPLDGLCHCGGETGPVCSAGQACELVAAEGDDEEEIAGVCSGTDICEGVVCKGGTTCSPLDGKCRCGGYDTTAPVCAEGQSCDQANRQCVGGDKCAGVTCDPKSKDSCDEEEGICKCGGTNGVVCEDDQGCVAGADRPICVTKCNPLTPGVEVEVCGHEAGSPMTCLYDAAEALAYCTPPGGSSDGQECEGPGDCAALHHCVEGGEINTCRPYCDIDAPNGTTNGCFGENRVCVPIGGSSAVIPRLGVCMVIGN